MIMAFATFMAGWILGVLAILAAGHNRIRNLAIGLFQKLPREVLDGVRDRRVKERYMREASLANMLNIPLGTWESDDIHYLACAALLADGDRTDRGDRERELSSLLLAHGHSFETFALLLDWSKDIPELHSALMDWLLGGVSGLETMQRLRRLVHDNRELEDDLK